MKCPFCAEKIKDEAIKCPFCKKFLEKTGRKPKKSSAVLDILLVGVIAFLLFQVFDSSFAPQAQEKDREKELAFQKEKEETRKAEFNRLLRIHEEEKQAAEKRRREEKEEELYKEAAKLFKEEQDRLEDIQITLALQLIQSEAEAKEKRDKLLKESQDRQMALALQLIQSRSGVIPSIPSLNTVVKARIINDFDGLKEGNIYKLDNGQIWEQTDFYIHTHIAIMPSVIIWRDGVVYKMIVDGIDKAVTIQQLK